MLSLQIACSSSDAKQKTFGRSEAPDATLVTPDESGTKTGDGGASTAGAGGASGSPQAAPGGAPAASSGGRAAGGSPADAAAPVLTPDAEADAGTCSSDGDCRAPLRFCAPAGGRCVECLSNNHCAAGQTCSPTDHTCKFACQTSADCSDPRPYCDGKRGECVECLSDTNCATGSKNICHSTTRTCVQCAANGDCRCLLPGQAPCCTASNFCTCGLLVCL